VLPRGCGVNVPLDTRETLMAKITLPDIAAQFASAAALNSRFQEIEDHLNDLVLYRENPEGEPNAMGQILDMNGYQIANLPFPVAPTDAVRLQDMEAFDVTLAVVPQATARYEFSDFTVGSGSTTFTKDEDQAVGLLYLNGVFQEAGTDYSYTSTVITFLAELLPADVIHVVSGNDTGLQVINQSDILFNTVADMISGTLTNGRVIILTVGQTARTLGYTAEGDGGDNTYEIVAAATGTDDGVSFIDLSGSGLQAKALFPNGKIFASQAGYSESNTSSQNNISLQAAIDYAEGVTDAVLLPAGQTCKITDITIPENMTIGSAGGGNQSFIDVVEATVTHAIKMNANYIVFKDVQVMSTTIGVGKGLIQTASMVYLKMYNVELNRMEDAFQYSDDNAFWGEYHGLILRDNTTGITGSTIPNRMNATAFYGLQTFHFAPIASNSEQAIVLNGQEGISIRGSIQNQGFSFEDCKGITLDLDYVEEVTGVSVLKAVNSEINMSSRPNWLSATASDIDDDSYAISSGWLPGTSRFNRTRYASDRMNNVLPETLNLTDWTLGNMGSSTGVPWNTETASGGSITLTSTQTTSRKSVTIASTNSIFIYARVVVTGDDVRISTTGGDSNISQDLEPSASDQFIRLWAERLVAGQMQILIFPLTANATTLEIKELLVSTDQNIASGVRPKQVTSGELVAVSRVSTQVNSDNVFVTATVLTTLFTVPVDMPDGSYVFSCNESSSNAARAYAFGIIYKTSTNLIWTPIVETLCAITIGASYDIQITMTGGQPNINMVSGLLRLS